MPSTPRPSLSPMLTVAAAAGGGLPDGPDWAHEVKWDGVRVLVHLDGGRVRLVSRAGNEVTGGYPELAALGRVHPSAVLDGEIVVLREGVPSFAALANRMHVREPRRAAELAASLPATLLAFDLLVLDGHDLTAAGGALTWTQRRTLLDALAEDVPPGGAWQVSPVHDDAAALLEATLAQGLEGVVAKRRSSTYRCGVRSPDWVKLPHRRVQSVLVGGWRPETGGRDRLGSLLVGVPDGGGGLTFAGRVGSGITAAVARRLQQELTARAENPFTTPVPAVDARGTHWTEPRLVVDVRYLTRGAQDRLRQPVFRGVRDDLTPADVRWEP